MGATIAEIRRARPGRGESLLLFTGDYTAVDVETTGLDPSFCDIIEIAAVRYRAGVEVGKFESLVHIDDELDEFIEHLTGITDEMLAGAPAAADVLAAFLDFVGDDTLLGHRAAFDVNFVYDTCARLGLGPLRNDFIDTMRLSRRLFPALKNQKLKTVAGELGVDVSRAHRAADDARTAGVCYEAMKRRAVESGVDLAELFAPHRHKLRAVDVTAAGSDFDEDGPVYGNLFVFTGVLEKVQRRDAMQAVVDRGGKCGDSVTKKTNYLVLGNNDFCSTIKGGKSTKQKKAEEYKLAGLDIEIISENVFYDMIEEGGR